MDTTSKIEITIPGRKVNTPTPRKIQKTSVTAMLNNIALVSIRKVCSIDEVFNGRCVVLNRNGYWDSERQSRSRQSLANEPQAVTVNQLFRSIHHPPTCLAKVIKTLHTSSQLRRLTPSSRRMFGLNAFGARAIGKLSWTCNQSV